MNMVNNIYRIIIIFLVCSCTVLLIKNYNVLKSIDSENVKLQFVEKNLKNQIKDKEQVSCTDILRKLKCIEGMQVINVASNNDGKLTIQFEVIGNQAEIKSILEKVKKIKYFSNIDNIKIEQDKFQGVKTKADVKFTQ
ncbi:MULTISPECIES: hypothetical protein [Clostridium]|uniref:Uncharacterized protein n=1 Tax=Clostridium ragsdalei P11 TaxID=1353534 RepID=A0A1A6AXV4_9CLOT|nr:MULTISPECIES: hypothetical protein [Clostridium]OBR94909.1 hypothetical protein CLRAG_12470 [Clostridium ragsdalei P11]QXE20337.1 hypothetical protein B5S50_16670 [Clostridium sp. 001]